MIIAAFYRGPFDGKRLVLPTEAPWPRFVIPQQWDPVVVEALYLFAGRIADDCAYLYEDDWADLLNSI